MNDETVVVIVEDDPNIADLVELYLRRDGFRPFQAATGERALEVIAQRRPRLILLDVGLPGPLDGIDVCRSSSSPPATTRSTGSSGWRWWPTTTSRNPSPRAKSSPG